MNLNFDAVARQAALHHPGRDAARPAQAGRLQRRLWPCAVAMLALLVLDSPAMADTFTRVYQSRMPNGSVVFGDQPVEGAREYRSREYRLPDPLPDDVLEAERLDWEQQARAFDRRHARRQALDAMRRASAHRDASWQTVRPAAAEYGGHAGWGWPSPPAHPVPPPPAGHASQYRSSPGAINGRQGSMLGSGFLAHPPRY